MASSSASSGKRARLAPTRPGRGGDGDGFEINYTPHYEVLVKEGQ